MDLMFAAMYTFMLAIEPTGEIILPKVVTTTIKMYEDKILTSLWKPTCAMALRMHWRVEITAEHIDLTEVFNVHGFIRLANY